jgi:hypothetical protein
MRHGHLTWLGGQHGEEGKGEDRREEESSCEAQGSEEEEVTNLRSSPLRASRRLDGQPGDIRRKIAQRKIAMQSGEMTPESATEGVGETEAWVPGQPAQAGSVRVQDAELASCGRQIAGWPSASDLSPTPRVF